VEIGEYRQVMGGVGIALFVSGMAIWPTGLIAKPLSWLLWGIGVGVGLLGIYVFTAAVVPSASLRLPGKLEAMRLVKRREDAHNILGAMRIEGMLIERNSDSEKFTALCTDLVEFVGAAWGKKYTTFFVPSMTDFTSLQEYMTSVMGQLDQFIRYCDGLQIRSDFRVDTARWVVYYPLLVD
jgi:hypothetical protein